MKKLLLAAAMLVVASISSARPVESTNNQKRPIETVGGMATPVYLTAVVDGKALTVALSATTSSDGNNYLMVKTATNSSVAFSNTNVGTTPLGPILGVIDGTNAKGITATPYFVSGTAATQHSGNVLMTSNPSVRPSGATGSTTDYVTVVGVWANNLGAPSGLCGSSLGNLGGVVGNLASGQTGLYALAWPLLNVNGQTGAASAIRGREASGTPFSGSQAGVASHTIGLANVNGVNTYEAVSATPTGRGNSLMVSVEGTQAPISQGDVTGLSVAGNMTVTPFTEAMDGFAGNAMMVRMTKPIATTLTATVTGAAGAAVTLSLPAVAAKYHYIQDVHIKLFATAARSAGAAAIIVPTTNLGNSFYILDAGATPKGEFAGSLEDTGGSWQRSAATNTATTLVFPAVTDCIWYAMVQYVAAP